MIDLESWLLEYKLMQKEMRKEGGAAGAIKLALKLHSEVHFSDSSDINELTFCDNIWSGLTDEVFSSMPQKRFMTIAWCFWHLYRIEDLVVNIAILDSSQIYNSEWHERINAGITDTGNALSYAETLNMSQRINKEELREYCVLVGKRTREMLSSMNTEKLTKKPLESSMQRIVKEGGLVENKHSIWLKDFWGGKTYAGLIQTPLLRHHLMHLPGCLDIKYQKQSK